MDPVSGVIAFVGFAASLLTLTEVLIKGCKTLSTVKLILEDAPGDVERLHRAMLRLQFVIVEVQRSEEDLRKQWANSSLAQHWAEHAHDVQRDISALSGRLSKLEEALAKKSHTSKNVRARVMKLFMEQELSKYERVLAEHQNTFGFFLDMITEYVCLVHPDLVCADSVVGCEPGRSSRSSKDRGSRSDSCPTAPFTFTLEPASTAKAGYPAWPRTNC